MDLGFGEFGAAVEVFFFVQPDGHTGAEASATATALVRRCLRHRFDGESLDLGPLAESRHACFADVDDVSHAGHSQRRLRNIGGDDDTASFRFAKDTLLFFGRQARVERQHFEVGLVASNRFADVVDLAFAAAEDQDVAWSLSCEFGDRSPHRSRDFEGFAFAIARLVANVDRVVAARHFDDRGIVEVGSNLGGINGGRGDDHM